MLSNLFLKLFIVLQGFGASSGLVSTDKDLYIVADDKAYVYTYNYLTNKTDSIFLETSVLPSQINRKNKPDIESVIIVENKLYCLGSGSKENRNDLFIVDLSTKKSERIDISSLFTLLKDKFQISDKDFNIEGFIYKNGYTFLFNRGNGKNKINAIFKFKGLPNDIQENSLEFIPIDLPIINGNLTTFSDAISLEDKIFFTATVEEESTVVKDGNIKESIVGIINPETYKVESYFIISNNKKIEGITIKKVSKNRYKFLFCEDNDDNSNLSKIYKMSILKKNFK